MALCTSQGLASNLLRDCSNLGVRGIQETVVAIRYTDLDRTASLPNKNVISSLVIKAGTSGVKIQGYKQQNSFSNTFVPSADAEEGFTHSFIGKMSGTSRENSLALSEMSGYTILVVKSKYLGTNEQDTFKVLGFKSGLTLTESTTVSGEAFITYTLSSEEGSLEQFNYHIYDTGDVAVNNERFEALFAVV